MRRFELRNEIRETATLGLPLMLAQLAQMSMSLIDTPACLVEVRSAVSWFEKRNAGTS